MKIPQRFHKIIISEMKRRSAETQRRSASRWYGVSGTRMRRAAKARKRLLEEAERLDAQCTPELRAEFSAWMEEHNPQMALMIQAVERERAMGQPGDACPECGAELEDISQYDWSLQGLACSQCGWTGLDP